MRTGDTERFLTASRALLLVPGLVLATLWGGLAEAQGPRLAVMDLRPGSETTVEQARTLTGMLRTSLYDTGAFTLINREDMEAIAQNHKIELVFCEDDACLLQIGSLLGAQKLVVGDIGIVAGEYFVNARLVDIGSRALVNERVTTRRSVQSAAALEKALSDLALDLAGVEMPLKTERLDAIRTESPDGSVLAIEGGSVLLSPRNPLTIGRRAILEVMRPLLWDSGGAGPDSSYQRPAAPIGRLRVVRTSATGVVAQCEPPLTVTDIKVGYPVRIFRSLPWFSLEPFGQYLFSAAGKQMDLVKSTYSPDVPGSLELRVHLTPVNVLDGPLVGGSVVASPSTWFQIGLRGSVAWIYKRTGQYEYVYTRPSNTVRGDYNVSREGVTLIGGLLRVKYGVTRKVDVFLEPEIYRIGWGFEVEDLRRIEGFDPPPCLGAIHVGFVRHSSARFGYAVSLGATRTLGGTWNASAASLRLAPAFGL